MKLLFSTNTIHPRDRLAYWREEASKAFVTHEFTSHVGRDFYGAISASALGDIGLAWMAGAPCTVARTQQCLRGSNDDDYLLCCTETGTLRVRQDGRDATAGRGNVFVLDPRRPFTLSVIDTSEGVFFKIPRADLEARLGDSATWTATLLPSAPASAIAAEFLLKTAECAAAIGHQSGMKIAQQALDLFALAMAPALGATAQLSSPRATTLLRLKSIIENELYSPALKPIAVAEAARISVRYANSLLAQEGTSLERYIMTRRLDRCRQALESATNLSRTIGDIAYGHGFADLSHFSRRFKERFGCSPGEVRPRTV
jgi:AraC family transcriptional regulator, positive regulator of tynA and feaB